LARNSSGTYTLPIASFVANTTIRSADMNSNLCDIATALTQSLATTGVSAMTGPVQLSTGSASAPSLTLASDATTGWYNSAAGAWTFVSTGTALITIGPTAIDISNLTVANLTVTGSFSVASARLVGEVVDYGGTSAPALWLLAFGQAISRTTYAALFAVIGTAFGVGDGVTTFNVPDYRGRVGIGKDNMGGVAANRITAALSGITGTTLGATGGAESATLVTANLAAHSHVLTDPGHDHGPVSGGSFATLTAGTFINNFQSGASFLRSQDTTSIDTTGITMATTGSGTAFSITQPGLIVNKIIYTGV